MSRLQGPSAASTTKATPQQRCTPTPSGPASFYVVSRPSVKRGRRVRRHASVQQPKAGSIGAYLPCSIRPPALDWRLVAAANRPQRALGGGGGADVEREGGARHGHPQAGGTRVLARRPSFVVECGQRIHGCCWSIPWAAGGTNMHLSWAAAQACRHAAGLPRRPHLRGEACVRGSLCVK